MVMAQKGPLVGVLKCCLETVTGPWTHNVHRSSHGLDNDLCDTQPKIDYKYLIDTEYNAALIVEQKEGY